MATTIESLELEIQQSSTSAVSGIQALSQTLQTLKNATKGITGLQRVANGIGAIRDAANGVSAESATRLNALADALRNISQAGRISPSVANQLTNIGNVMQSLNGVSFAAIESLATALNALSGLGQFTLSSSIANQLVNIGVAADTLQGVNFDAFRHLAEALQPLMNLGNFDLRGLVNSLNRIPRLADVFNGVDWGAFTGQIQQMADALAPLTTQLNTLSEAFNRLPANLRNAVNATNRLSTANRTATTSYVNLWARARMAYNMIAMGSRIVAQWINKSNEYIENVNLFTASLGKYADEAKAYADQVSELMGIDPAVWMRQQGVFNTITKGFGVATDKAYLMSQQLTQLGYDISSFYNISIEDAMTKLQSGIAGELEPLRRLGYDLSVARLQEEALALGISKKVSKMTQAEKSQLRYVAIMKQVNMSHGDMARTLETPANMLRILKAQFEQLGRALGNLFLPALQKVLPWLIAIVKVLREIIEGMASLVGFEMPKIDYTGISDVGEEAEKATKEVKELKRTIMGFDEINALQKDKSKNKSSGSGIGSEFDLDITPYSYDFLGGLNTQIDDLVAKIKDALWEIETVASGFSLGLGVLLVATGANVPVGLGLIALGAYGLAKAITANWNTMSDRLAGVLSQVTAMLGGFLLAIGVLLTTTGHPALGIALIVAGAASLVTSTVIDWKFLSGKIESVLTDITGIVGGALLGLGAILSLTGHPAIGVALLAAGALGIVASVSLSWDEMPNKIKEVLSLIGMIAGSFMLALGLLLLSTPVSTPIAVALIAAGASSMVSAAVINWNYIVDKVSEFLSSIAGLIVGSALLAIGIILTMTGVATPLGIGMIVAGAAGLVTSVALNWSSIVDAVSKFLSEIGALLGGAMIVLGILVTMTGIFTPLGIGMIIAGVGSLAASVALNWSSIVKAVKQFFSDIGKKVVEGWNNIKKWTSEKWETIKTTVLNVWEMLKTKAGQAFETIKNTVSTAWTNVKTWTSEKWETAKKTAFEVWDSLKTKASTIFTSVSSFVSTAWTNVKTWTSEKWEAVKDKATGIWDSLSQNASTTFGNIGSYVSEAWGSAQTVLGDFIRWIETTFSGDWGTAWNGIVEGFGRIFGTVTDKMKAPVNAVIGLINNMIDAIETAINQVVRGINKKLHINLKWDVPDWVPGIGGNKYGWEWSPNLKEVSWGHVNELANGGILTMPTMLTPDVLAGEAGREAVLPLDRNTDWMDKVAARVAAYVAPGAIYDGGAKADERELELLRQQNRLLQQLLEKDTTVEITTNSIAQANQRMNRRAGVTVAPVGT